MKFVDVAVSREGRFSIGVEKETGKFYLSIPVSNSLVDYEEYYEITREMFERCQKDMKEALFFADECREGKKDSYICPP